MTGGRAACEATGLAVWVLSVVAALSVPPGCVGAGGAGGYTAPPPGGDGLDVQRWTVPGSGLAVGGALAGYAESAAERVDAGALALLESSGVRVMIVPRAGLETIHRALRPVGGVSTTRHGPMPSWTPVFRSDPVADGAVLVGGEVTRLPRGAVHLLARAWIRPEVVAAPGGGAVVEGRLEAELVFQHRPASSERSGFTTPSRLVPEEAMGRAFGQTRLELSLRDGEALLLIGERPGVAWGEASVGGVGTVGAAGPSPPPVPSLGELAMIEPGAGADTTRTVIVVIPRVSGAPRMLGAASP